MNKWQALALASVFGLPAVAYAEHDGQVTVSAVRGTN